MHGFFESEKIEYYTVLPYSACREINSAISARQGFVSRSVILYLVPYYVGRGENLSKYSTSLDYHILLHRISEGLISELKGSYPENNFCAYGDHSPIDERHAAAIGGLGRIGENGLLINDKYGSYVFIGEVVSDISAEVLGAKAPCEIKHCIGCSRCKVSCPTGTLCDENKECLSSITQKKGMLSEYEISLMRECNTVWGCDICQDCCPHNANPETTPIDFFKTDRIERLTGEALDSMSDKEFSTRAFAWRKRKTIERNLDYLEKI